MLLARSNVRLVLTNPMNGRIVVPGLLSAILISAVIAATTPAGRPGLSVTPGKWTKTNSGCDLTIEVSFTGGELVALELARSTIERWRDDKGTDYGRKGPGLPNYETGPLYASVASGTTMTLTSRKAPPASAATMMVDGTLHFSQATARKTGELKNLVLRPGTKFDLAGHACTISAVEGNGVEMEIVTPAETGLAFLKELSFLDAAGNELPISGENSSASATEGAPTKTYRVRYRLAAPAPARCTLKYTAFTGLKKAQQAYKVQVPKAP